MTPITNQFTITEDGEYNFEAVENGRSVRLEWAFIEGAATVEPGYVDLLGNFHPAVSLDGTAPVFDPTGGMCDVGIGNSSYAALRVTASDLLQLIVCQTLIPIR